MRVISGSAKGRRLKSLEGNDIRPTTDKVKEAVFSAIQFDIEGRRFLDLFAGSGQMGIEALSRGAKNAVFIDGSERAVKICSENLKVTGLEVNAKVVRSDALSYITQTSNLFDIAFLDPPYAEGLLEKVLYATADKMSDFGIIICEHPPEITLPDEVKGFSVFKKYSYGKINVTTYKKEN